MDPLLLGTATAFERAAAAGLNTSLPLFLVGLAARFGLLNLTSPYDALASDVALIGLGISLWRDQRKTAATAADGLAPARVEPATVR